MRLAWKQETIPNREPSRLDYRRLEHCQSVCPSQVGSQGTVAHGPDPNAGHLARIGNTVAEPLACLDTMGNRERQRTCQA